MKAALKSRVTSAKGSLLFHFIFFQFYFVKFIFNWRTRPATLLTRETPKEMEQSSCPDSDRTQSQQTLEDHEGWRPRGTRHVTWAPILRVHSCKPERFDSRAFSVPDTTRRAHFLDSQGEEAWQSSTAEDGGQGRGAGGPDSGSGIVATTPDSFLHKEA